MSKKNKYHRGIRQVKAGAKKNKHYHRGPRKQNWFAKMALWKKILIAFLLLILIGVGLVCWYVFTKWQKVDTQEIAAEDIIINKEVQENLSVDLGQGYTNVALFGVDTREGDLGTGSRTDCIIVASLNNETKEVKMVSVYRDTLLDLSEGTYQKCNAAYSFGGPTMAINMLNMDLDLNIQDYVTVDFGAIADVIDQIGGLEIDVTDEEAEEMNNHILGTGLEAGKEVHYMEHGGLQLLDGVQATTYARVRSTAGGDFTRTQRQRLVIEKILEKLKSSDIGTINQIIDKVFPQISTSFSLPEILNYAKAYKEYVIAGSQGFPYEDLLTMDSIPDVGSVVVPYNLTENVSRMHEFLFGTVGYVPSSTVNTVSSNILSRLGSGGGSSSTSSGYDYDYSEDETYNDYSYDTGTTTDTYNYTDTTDTTDSYSEYDNSGSDYSGDSYSGSTESELGYTSGDGL